MGSHHMIAGNKAKGMVKKINSIITDRAYQSGKITGVVSETTCVAADAIARNIPKFSSNPGRTIIKTPKNPTKVAINHANKLPRSQSHEHCENR